jgi:hypothetical protein
VPLSIGRSRIEFAGLMVAETSNRRHRPRFGGTSLLDVPVGSGAGDVTQWKITGRAGHSRTNHRNLSGFLDAFKAGPTLASEAGFKSRAAYGAYTRH